MGEILTILTIALSLAMDALAVSVSAGIYLRDASRMQAFRIYFHFGLFQGLFPILGWIMGHSVSPYFLGYNKYIAFGLLLYVGIHMIIEALGEGDGQFRTDPTRGLTLVMLATSVSIDAMAVGISFSLLGLTVVYPALIIGLVTGLVSMAGVKFGTRLGRRFGDRVSVLGGIVLIMIGLKILLSG